MNRKVLALAITALLAANAANAAEMYNKDGNKVNINGKLEAAYQFRDLGSNDQNIENKDKTFARFGFDGETQINSQLTGYAKFEHEFTPDNRPGNGDGDNTRLAYVGLKYANLGSLDFGRNNGVVGLVRDFTDVSPVFGGDGFGGGADIFMTGRASGVATYSVEDAYGTVEGLNMYLQYQAKDSGAAQNNTGDGLGFTTTYEHAATGVGAAFTYANSDRTESQRLVGGTDGNNAEIWGIAAKYDANNIYAAVSWAQSNNMIHTENYGSAGSEFAHRTRGLEAIAQYTFDFGLTPSVVYNQTRGRDLTQDISSYYANPADAPTHYSAYLTKYVGLAAGYAFNKNIDMAVGYKINLINEDAYYTKAAGIATDDQVEMRLTYSF